MDKIRITGGNRLNGTINVGGAKNAALPLMAASLLTEGTLRLSNLPHLADVSSMAGLLAQHGVSLQIGKNPDGTKNRRTMEMRAKSSLNTMAPYDIVRKMRASVLVLGPLVARCGRAKVSLPGGCAIGTRPVDLHLSGLSKMGAHIDIENGYVLASAPTGLHGERIIFPMVSVGATENLLMAACLAKGETVLQNAAKEPEIVDLALCLRSMGAEIEGIGTDTLVIQGKEKLHGADHDILPDRIEAGTYAAAVAAAGGKLFMPRVQRGHMESFADFLRTAGASVEFSEDGMSVSADGLVAANFKTDPFPGFPTDLQAQGMAMMCVAEGTSTVTETIFENRFMHVQELARMGADIAVHGSMAVVRGQRRLTGAEVMATDLRASASLIVAALAAEGRTEISRVYHLDRGYENLEEKLKACGAEVERFRSQEK